MITTFIADRMSAYIAGGMTPANAARLTMGELGAIYRGNHYSRNGANELHITLPPEALDIEVAKKKAGATLSEFMRMSAGSGAGQAPGTLPERQR